MDNEVVKLETVAAIYEQRATLEELDQINIHLKAQEALQNDGTLRAYSSCVLQWSSLVFSDHACAHVELHFG